MWKWSDRVELFSVRGDLILLCKGVEATERQKDSQKESFGVYQTGWN